MLQTELDFINGRTEIRGRIAYDEANERFRFLQQYEFRNPSSDYFFGRYFFYKEVKKYYRTDSTHANINISVAHIENRVSCQFYHQIL